MLPLYKILCKAKKSSFEKISYFITKQNDFSNSLKWKYLAKSWLSSRAGSYLAWWKLLLTCSTRRESQLVLYKKMALLIEWIFSLWAEVCQIARILQGKSPPRFLIIWACRACQSAARDQIKSGRAEIWSRSHPLIKVKPSTFNLPLTQRRAAQREAI